MSLTPEDRFNIEILKLLIQVAWNDEHITGRERVVVLGLGRHWKVPEPELHALEQQLLAGHRLPPPDLGLLRSNPQKVLSAAAALASADGRIEDAERELIQQIAGLLNVRLE